MSKKKKGLGLPGWLGLLVILVIGGYSGYWFWMSGEIRKGALDWIEDQRKAGVDITYDNMEISGFPYRFELKLDAPVAVSSVDGWRLESERVQLAAQSYNLYHVIAQIPGKSDITLADGRQFSLVPAEKSALSVRYDSETVRDLRIELPSLTIAENNMRVLELNNLMFGIRPMPDAPTSGQLAFSIDDFTLERAPDDLIWLGPDGEELVIWIEIENLYPLLTEDLSFTEWRIDENQIHLRRGEVNWGPLDLAARASIELSRDNQPNGTIGIHLENVDALREHLEAAGRLDQETNQLIGTIGLMSRNNNFATVELRDRGIYLLGNKLGEY